MYLFYFILKLDDFKANKDYRVIQSGIVYGSISQSSNLPIPNLDLRNYFF